MADRRRRSESSQGAYRQRQAKGTHASYANSLQAPHRAGSGNKRGKSSAGGKSAPKKKRKRKMPLWKKTVLMLMVILLLIIFGVIGVLASKLSLLQTDTLNADALSISDELTYDESGYLNVALFGLDTRENDVEMGTRSDTIMVASLNRETKEVKLASVYRDTLLQQDDGTYNKANSAYSFGEAEEAVAMLNRNLDLDIQHYVTVDFSAMVDIIDALGGVEIDVTEEEIPYINGYAVEIIKNTGVDTWAVEEPGLQNLTGVQATAYARIRYTDGDDFKRAERQRTVLTKIAEKAQGASLSTLNKIIDRVFPKVQTNFKLPEILAYAKDVKKYQLCETTGFPEVKDTMDYEDAGNVVIPITLVSNVRTLHEYLFTDESYVPSSKVSDISEEIEYLSGMGEDYEDSGNTDESSGYTDGMYENGYNTDGSGGYNYSDGSGYTDGGSGYTENTYTGGSSAGTYTGGTSDGTYGGSASGGTSDGTYGGSASGGTSDGTYGGSASGGTSDGAYGGSTSDGTYSGGTDSYGTQGQGTSGDSGQADYGTYSVPAEQGGYTDSQTYQQ